jgi:glycosyltransferase involved in cell wall biosynthesis
VIVLTQQNRQYVVDHGIYREERIREVPNGVPMDMDGLGNAENAGRLKSRFGISSESPVILTTARIAPMKNIDLIFRIAPSVVQRFPDAVFVIAGAGPQLEEFRAKSRAMGLEKFVYMTGFHSRIDDLLGIADIFLLPSFLELHSLAILEAMSAKKPVVVSKDTGCNSEFIRDWENGVLLDPFQDTGWAEAVIRLLKSPELRQKMGQNGYETCKEKFEIKRTAREVEKIYGELILQEAAS